MDKATLLFFALHWIFIIWLIYMLMKTKDEKDAVIHGLQDKVLRLLRDKSKNNLNRIHSKGIKI